jgi:uncharacterized protein with PQ loop repeat
VCNKLPGFQREFKIGRHVGPPVFEGFHERRLIESVLYLNRREPVHIVFLFQPKSACSDLDLIVHPSCTELLKHGEQNANVFDQTDARTFTNYPRLMTIEILGWASSLILLATLVKQVYKQWKDRTSEGISSLLFIGQLAASIGFTIYSVATGSWVFAFTNAALTVNNIIGIWLYFRYRD